MAGRPDRSGSSGLESKVLPSPETAAAQRSNPMTGLDLESFLLLLRADLTTWVVLGLATVGLAVLVWSSWRSRRALRNCLVLSLAAHLGLVLYGSTIPAVMWTLGPDRRDAPDRTHIRQIRVAPLVESNASTGGPRLSDSGQVRSAAERWDLSAAPCEAGGRLAQDRPAERRRSIGDRFSNPRSSWHRLPPLASASPRAKDARGDTSGVASRADRRRITATSPISRCRCLPFWLKSIRLTPKLRFPRQRWRKPARKQTGNPSLSHDPALASDRRLRPDRIRSNEPNPAGIRFTVDEQAGTERARTPKGRGTRVATGAKGQGTKLPRASDAMVVAGEPIPLARATPNSRTATC